MKAAASLAVRLWSSFFFCLSVSLSFPLLSLVCSFLLFSFILCLLLALLLRKLPEAMAATLAPCMVASNAAVLRGSTVAAPDSRCTTVSCSPFSLIAIALGSGFMGFFLVRVLDDDLDFFFCGFSVLGVGLVWVLLGFHLCLWVLGGRRCGARHRAACGETRWASRGALARRSRNLPEAKVRVVEMSGKSASLLGTVAVFWRQICGSQLRTPSFAWLRKSLKPLALFPLPFCEIQPVCNRALS